MDLVLLSSATVCLLIGAFSPLTFQIIIDRYVLIPILLVVFQLFAILCLFLLFLSFFFFFCRCCYFLCSLMIFYNGTLVSLSSVCVSSIGFYLWLPYISTYNYIYIFVKLVLYVQRHSIRSTVFTLHPLENFYFWCYLHFYPFILE